MMKKVIKQLLAISLIPAMVFLMSCEDDDATPNPTTVVDVAISDPQFSILVDALTKADLASALEGNGPFTVFAPTNAAFTTLLMQLGVSSLDDLTAEQLTPILLNHVIAGEITSATLSTGYYATLNDSAPASRNVMLYIEVGSGVTINGTVEVTSADIDASNGVIHVINEVILPTDIVDIAATNDNFTSLVGALAAAEGDLVNVLKSDGPFTVFAPINAAFTEINDVVSGLTSTQLAEILQYHVVAGTNVVSGSLADGQVISTINGTLTVHMAGSVITLMDETGASATVMATDVQGTNGIIHVIDKVLLKEI